jgi:hypothetical protein
MGATIANHLSPSSDLFLQSSAAVAQFMGEVVYGGSGVLRTRCIVGVFRIRKGPVI